jgi:hypothetical protein
MVINTTFPFLTYIYVFISELIFSGLGTSFSPSPHYKLKAIPLRTLTGPEGSRRLRLPDFKTIDT